MSDKVDIVACQCGHIIQCQTRSGYYTVRRPSSFRTRCLCGHDHYSHLHYWNECKAEGCHCRCFLSTVEERISDQQPAEKTPRLAAFTDAELDCIRHCLALGISNLWGSNLFGTANELYGEIAVEQERRKGT